MCYDRKMMFHYCFVVNACISSHVRSIWHFAWVCVHTTTALPFHLRSFDLVWWGVFNTLHFFPVQTWKERDLSLILCYVRSLARIQRTVVTSLGKLSNFISDLIPFWSVNGKGASIQIWFVSAHSAHAWKRKPFPNKDESQVIQMAYLRVRCCRR